MAKKGNVKKGFATYVMILFIAILASFFIIITIMMFSPFKNILGFKYFVYRHDEIHQTDMTKQKNELSFNNIENININCNTATVRIERKLKLDKCAIQVENVCTGFARGDQDTDFTYDISFTDEAKKNLQIKMHEPEGFLFLSKNIKVTILIPTKPVLTFPEGTTGDEKTKCQNDPLINTNINIITTNGDIYVGNNGKITEKEGDNENYTSIKGLNIKSTKGNITLTPFVNKIDNLFLKTSNSSVSVRKEVNVQDLQIYSTNSNVSFNNINTTKGNLDLGNSTFEGGNFTSTDNVDFSIDSGRFNVKKFTGNLTSNNNKILTNFGNATINIDNFKGELSFPNIGQSQVTINTVLKGSSVLLRSTSGELKIKGTEEDDATSSSKIIAESTSGNVSINTSFKNTDILTGSGTINLTYNRSQVEKDSLKVKSTSGTINLSVNLDLKFTLNVYNSIGEQRSKNNVSVAGYGNQFDLPLRIDGDAPINLYTNGKVNVSFH